MLFGKAVKIRVPALGIKTATSIFAKHDSTRVLFISVIQTKLKLPDVGSF